MHSGRPSPCGVVCRHPSTPLVSQVVHFELYRGDEACGALHLVDLAGSERLSRTEATGERRAEGVAVNKSLSALGDVMQALVGKTEHVPYRNSRLTQLLQPGLSKGCRVALLLAASPADASARYGWRELAGSSLVMAAVAISALDARFPRTARRKSRMSPPRAPPD